MLPLFVILQAYMHVCMIILLHGQKQGTHPQHPGDWECGTSPSSLKLPTGEAGAGGGLPAMAW